MKALKQLAAILISIYLLTSCNSGSGNSTQTNNAGSIKIDSAAKKDSAKESKDLVELKGEVITELHYGPPGFGEDTVNEKVYPYILLLENKIENKWASESDEEKYVNKIQLAFPEELSAKVKKLKNKKVIVKGELYHWDNGTQYTPVLIWLIKIDEQ